MFRKSAAVLGLMFSAPIVGVGLVEALAPMEAAAQVDYFNQPYTAYPAPLGSWAFQATLVVTTSDTYVNGYQRPHYRGRIISAFYPGEIVEAERAYFDYNTGDAWYLVQSDEGVRGWVNEDAVKLAPTPTPIP